METDEFKAQMESLGIAIPYVKIGRMYLDDIEPSCEELKSARNLLVTESGWISYDFIKNYE